MPAILTLSARPTWATGGVQCLSARMSGNLSRPASNDCAPGRPPTHWANNPNGWPSPWTYGSLRQGKTPGSTNPDDYEGGTRFREIYPNAIDTTLREMYLRKLFNDPARVLPANFAAAMLSAFANTASYSPDAPWLRRAYDDPSIFRIGATHEDIVVSVILPTFV